MMVTSRSSSSELSSPALIVLDLELNIAPRGYRNDAPLVQIDVGLLADDVGVPSTNTFDLSQGVHDLALSIDVCVQQTENVLVVTRLVRFLRGRLDTVPGTVGELLGRRGTWWREMKLSGQKSHVSPSKHKTVNPPPSARFSLVDRIQGDRRGSVSSVGFETHIDIFGTTTNEGVSCFSDCWSCPTLTLNLANGICRTINATTRR